MSYNPIGTVSNYADEKSLHILTLWKDSISKIESYNNLQSKFDNRYSHFIVVHDSFDFKFSEKQEEWNLRFTGDIGVSVVEFLKSDDNGVYVKGLFAENNSNVYEVLPYTSFDSLNATYPHPAMKELRTKVLGQILPNIDGNYILDIGCGVGSITMDIAEQNPDSSVYGIEIEENLINQCKMNSEILEISNVNFKTGDIYDLPFENDAVDTVTCFFMLHHLDDIPAGLEEIKRVLSGGGHLITTDPFGHHHGPEITEENWKNHFENAGFSTNIEKIGNALVTFATLK
ncbi:Methyltransferase type 11 [Methanohalobium evestigatum Z-7303]|uniref:Methyltransferase type 11 n=1 Tax=Methanohalobium evestigatum (strain ATCC BAA-1072 / DSM 3721 / NBRC 107634 / OCM 161 / Z-7303) TaxID=644295 RepID=D7E9V9_METEZ|nr:methyltransferase domain-containing protein [Methanohalobium evestigatum]ADI74381.1 Methyltransferase type 11 [Methanohalobium evestigatum Z-7303]